LATLGYGDAIGNEVLGIQRVLRTAGYESEIFVETADSRLEDLTLDYRDLPDGNHADDVLLHHFSLAARASRLTYALPNRMALIYHNITPPEYFIDVHPHLVQSCFVGRRELGLFASRAELGLGDSEYNRQELEALGFPYTDVLPVVPDFSHLSGPANYMQAGLFDDGWVNVVFVGRMIPNKKIEDVIRFFHAYNRWFNPRSRLLLVGAYNGFERYIAMLLNLITRLNVSDVHFLGHVSNAELTAYYELADVFLCASEHEGFCVPLVESFHMGIPVLAYPATAVPATMDGGGILYEDKDPVRVAALMHQVITDRQLATNIIASQDAALERLLQKDFSGTLLRFVEQMAQAPPRPHPPVAFDFWDQVRESDSLDELRRFRPAAYQALPKALAPDAPAGVPGPTSTAGGA
jgi:glycosyltransferase involved in cell wall biosynthesis